MVEKLVVENLAKRYGDLEAVRGVSFSAYQGEIFGLLGPNGAGKTSTIECLVGLRAADNGRVCVCGLNALAEPQRVKQLVGVALQSTALQDKITPREALRLFGSFYERRVIPQQLIERFSLTEKADAPFHSLSGGQRQRLALALAFVNEPELLFLDEPTAGLDPQSRRELHASILRMRAEGRTVVLSTHYIDEAEALCDRVAIIDHGLVIAIGTPAELISRSRALPHISVTASKPLEAARLSLLPAVTAVETDGNRARLTTSNTGSTLIELVRLLQVDENDLTDLHIHQPTLENVFIELTGSKLRD